MATRPDPYRWQDLPAIVLAVLVLWLLGLAAAWGYGICLWDTCSH